ncbi:MAG: hypothetical protein ABFR32_09055 [Bacteroidota bacterium]
MSDMKRRFSLYGFGFIIGILLVFFFLGGKKASCNWLPNDRMLKIIRSKQINYSSEATQILNTKTVDSADIAQILIKGDIDFSKSNVKNNPCRKYLINGKNKQKNIVLTIQVCDSIATIQEIIFK